MIKKILFFLFINFIFFPTFSQIIGDFSFTGLPQDNQLYPRNSANVSEIRISCVSAKTTSPNLKMFLYRNQAFKQVVLPINQIFTFSVKSELAEYDLSFYSYTGKDSVLIVKRSNIVSGDIILVSGQSNAKLGPMNKNVYQGEFLRTFGKNSDQKIDLSSSYNLSDTLWSQHKLNLNLDPIAADYMGLGLGPFASEVGKNLIESEGIPIAIISNAQPSSTIDYHLNLSGDLKSPKGGDILYYKLAKAKLLDAVKTIIFVQGEAEILGNVANTWVSKFNLLKSNYLKYFPNLVNWAVPQLNIYPFKSSNSAFLRDEQRRMSSQTNMISWATVGNTGFDGLHYFGNAYKSDLNNLYAFENEGYLQMAKEVSRIVSKKVYNKNYDPQIQSPNIQRAYFPDGKLRNKLILEFDEGQDLVFSTDTSVIDAVGKKVTHSLKNNFFWQAYNQGSMGAYITQISASGNKLTLNFNVDYDGEIISYLPEFQGDNSNTTNPENYPFPGPFLKNKLGMRAFAFSNIKIESIFQNLDEFELYPNPAGEFHDWIEMKWPKKINGTVSILDLSGRIIFTRKITDQQIININLFAAGLKRGKYFINFQSDAGGSFSKTIIKY